MERIDVHIHIHDDRQPDPRIDQVLSMLTTITSKENRLMADLTALTAEVNQNGDVIASAVTVLGNLSQQIRDLSTDPAALAALADELDANSASLATAIAATEPPVEPPVEPPTT